MNTRGQLSPCFVLFKQKWQARYHGFVRRHIKVLETACKPTSPETSWETYYLVILCMNFRDLYNRKSARSQNYIVLVAGALDSY